MYIIPNTPLGSIPDIKLVPSDVGEITVTYELGYDNKLSAIK